MGFSPKTRGRCWIATIHIANMQKAELTKEQYTNPKYLADFFIKLWQDSGKGRTAGIAVCLSQDNCYHAHMALYGNTTTLKAVSDVLFQSHVEPQLGGKEQLKAYLLKEGKFAEKGEQVLYTLGLENIEDKQGKRSDYDEIEAMIEDGYTPSEIFDTAFRYRKYAKMIKDAYFAKLLKDTPLIKKMHNEWHFGESGTGKTYTYYKLCEEHTTEDVYLCSDYSNSSGSGGGFDFYSDNPSRILVLDEFRGNIPFQQLLTILDVYSRQQQHARYSNVYALWTSVYICSIYPPEKVYTFMVEDSERNTDSIKQLLRRLNTIVYHYKDINGNYKTYSMPANEYTNAFDMINRANQAEFENMMKSENTENYKDFFLQPTTDNPENLIIPNPYTPKPNKFNSEISDEEFNKFFEEDLSND